MQAAAKAQVTALQEELESLRIRSSLRGVQLPTLGYGAVSAKSALEDDTEEGDARKAAVAAAVSSAVQEAERAWGARERVRGAGGEGMG
jgi:hypothetical protein